MQRPDRPIRSLALEAEGRDIVERLGGEWRGSGGLCRCPAHDDRSPSLSVRPGERRLLFHCFAGCETRNVLRALSALKLLGSGPEPGGSETAPSPADPGARHRGAAQRLWAAARTIRDSPAETYLRSRGLALAVSDLRFHPRTPCGRGAQAVFRPALLAAARDDSGLVAVHRTFLDRSGRLAALPLPKRALGRLGQGAVRLSPPRQGTLGWAEGIESAMAAAQLTGIACWAVLRSERFARVALPPGVRRLVLFLDNDAGGRRAEGLAREAHRGGEVEVETRYAEPAGADWNDVLLGRTR